MTSKSKGAPTKNAVLALFLLIAQTRLSAQNAPGAFDVMVGPTSAETNLTTLRVVESK